MKIQLTKNGFKFVRLANSYAYSFESSIEPASWWLGLSEMLQTTFVLIPWVLKLCASSWPFCMAPSPSVDWYPRFYIAVLSIIRFSWKQKYFLARDDLALTEFYNMNIWLPFFLENLESVSEPQVPYICRPGDLAEIIWLISTRSFSTGQVISSIVKNTEKIFRFVASQCKSKL